MWIWKHKWQKTYEHYTWFPADRKYFPLETVLIINQHFSPDVTEVAGSLGGQRDLRLLPDDSWGLWSSWWEMRYWNCGPLGRDITIVSDYHVSPSTEYKSYIRLQFCLIFVCNSQWHTKEWVWAVQIFLKFTHQRLSDNTRARCVG
jgi:hypothetical protein